MLYKILLLLSGLILLLINERIALRRLSKMLVLPQSRKSPWLFSLETAYTTVQDKPQYIRNQTEAFTLLWLKITPETLREQVFVDFLRDQGGGTPLICVIAPEVEEGSTVDFQDFTRKLYPAFQELKSLEQPISWMVFANFFSPKTPWETYWSQVVGQNGAFFPAILLDAAVLQAEGKEIPAALLQKSQSALSQTYQRSRRLAQHSAVLLRFREETPSSWWEALVDFSMSLTLLREPGIVGLLQQVTSEAFHPKRLFFSYLTAASRHLPLAQGVAFQPTQLLDDLPEGMAMDAVRGYMFSKNWQQSLILINLSDYPIQIDLAEIFMRDFYAEQIYCPTDKVYAPMQDMDYVQSRLGRKTGGITLMPFSVSHLSSSYFIPLSVEKNRIDIGLSLEKLPELGLLNIQYTLETPWKLNILIMDEADRIKFRLDKQHQKEGLYELQFDIQRLRPGRYTLLFIAKEHLWQQSFEI